MARKTFKGGLDSLLSSTGLDKEIKDGKEEKIEQKELSKEEQHWLLLKTERLRKELKLWRTGELTVEKFHESLKEHNLSYNSETNEIK